MNALWILVALAAPANVVVPVQGTLSGPSGAPLEGVSPVVFRLYDGTTQVFEETQNVVFTGGTFGAQLGVSVSLSSALLSASDLTLSTQVGGVEGDGVPVGWAPRAAHAHHAATADDADRLGGALPEAYVRWSDGYTPGSGLRLTGRAFSLDPAAVPNEAQVESWVTNGALNLAAGSTINGASLAPLTESAIEGYITNGPINLATGSTINGVSLAPLTESVIEGYITNGPINLASGSTLNGVSLAPLSESTVEGYITNGPINLASGSTLNGVSLAPLSESTIESYITNGPLALAAGTTIGGSTTSGVVRNVTIQTSATRRVLSDASNILMESFTVDKKSPTSTLLIQGTISGWGNYSGDMQQSWRLGAGTAVQAQSVMYGQTAYSKIYSTSAVISGHTTTGAQTLEFRYYAANGGGGNRPFQVYNPNGADEGRMAQTQSVYVVWELQP
jgi:hypothetical protein